MATTRTLKNLLPTRLLLIPARTKYWHNRHRDQRYRVERARKLWRIDIPDFDYMRKDSKLSPDEIRSKLKEKGIAPPIPWEEREVFIPSTYSLIEEYKPSSDGKSSLRIPTKVVALAKDEIKNRRALSVIRTFEGEEFNFEEFAKQSLDIYIKAHEAMASKNENKIFDYVTEYCFPIMTAGINNHTVIWKYLGEIEPPRVVLARVAELVSKSNKYSQITVKLHTKQILALYDRHGRLTNGSPTDVKEVFEYVVFEKYLANEYGSWRIHERIRPKNEEKSVEYDMKTYVM